MRKVYVAGGAHTTYIGKFHPDFIWKKHPDFGKKENPTLEQYLCDAAIEALASVAATAAAVDKAYVGNFVGELFSNQGHLGALLAAADPDLAGKPIARVEGACASGGLALASGFDAIRAGAEVVLVVGAEVQTTQNAKVGADYLARAAHYRRQRGVDAFTFPAVFARRAKALVEQTEATMEDFARAAVKAYRNANKNPLAHMHAVTIDLEHANTPSPKNPAFLENEEVKDYLRVTDCSQVSDGASAIVLCSEEGLARIGSAELNRKSSFAEMLRRPEIHLDSFLQLPLEEEMRNRAARLAQSPEKQEIELRVKFKGYIERQEEQVARFKKMENLLLPEDIDYASLPGLSAEVVEKLQNIAPQSLGRASRISGVTPAAISVLQVHLRRLRHNEQHSKREKTE